MVSVLFCPLFQTRCHRSYFIALTSFYVYSSLACAAYPGCTNMETKSVILISLFVNRCLCCVFRETFCSLFLVWHFQTVCH
jgi:hypothetical protein